MVQDEATDLVAHYPDVDNSVDVGADDPMSALAPGLSLAEQGDLYRAQAVFERVLESGDRIACGPAAWGLGRVFEERHEPEAALLAFGRSVDFGYEAAAFDLARFLKGEGDIEGAVAAFRRAIASGDPIAAPNAANNLGNLLSDLGDVDGAISAYRYALDSGHLEAAPGSARQLGYLLWQGGDFA